MYMREGGREDPSQVAHTATMVTLCNVILYNVTQVKGGREGGGVRRGRGRERGRERENTSTQ